jgi:hypothetical protein
MLKDLKTKVPSLPQSLSDIIEEQYGLMWQVGYEHRGKQLVNKRWNKREYLIQQFDRDGRLLNEYPTPQDAVRYGNICRSSLWSALGGRQTIHGHFWKRKYVTADNLTSPQSGNNGKPLPEKSISPVQKKSSSVRMP